MSNAMCICPGSAELCTCGASLPAETPERDRALRDKAWDDIQWAVYQMLEAGYDHDQIHEAVQMAEDDAAES
jgi:hypothetical protein